MDVPDVLWPLLLGAFVLATVLQLAAWWTCGVFAFSNPGPIPASTQERTEGAGAVSIIICARNEAENLRRFLPAFLSQEYDSPWELLVVDDASEDDTPRVLDFFMEKNPGRLRVLRIAEKKTSGKKYALAQGISTAKHDLLLLSDADCAPASPYWLQQMAHTLRAKPETEIVLGYAPLRGNRFARYEAAYTAAQYFAFAWAGMPYMGVGRNLAFKRQVFNRVGGFSAHAHLLSGDDDLLVNAAANAQNTAICCTAASFVYSEAPASTRAWVRQKHRHLSAGPAYRWPHKIMLALLALSMAGHYCLGLVLLVAGVCPGLTLGLIALRFCSVGLAFGKMLAVFKARDLLFRMFWYDVLLAGYYGLLVPVLMLWKKPLNWV